MTETLTTGKVVCRAVSEADDAFLRRVYASTRAHELALVPWSDEEKWAFVSMQFDAQTTHYRNTYVGASHEVIEVDGIPAGRLYVAVWPSEIRIVDITLLPEFCGRGIGTGLVSNILEQGRLSGRSVSIHVELENPARRLYERLGFVEIAQHGIYTLMEWRSS